MLDRLWRSERGKKRTNHCIKLSIKINILMKKEVSSKKKKEKHQEQARVIIHNKIKINVDNVNVNTFFLSFSSLFLRIKNIIIFFGPTLY